MIDLFWAVWETLHGWTLATEPVWEWLHAWTTYILLYVGTPVQITFVVLYFGRKWRKYRFSRSLMWKSGSLALYLYGSWSKVLVAGVRNYDWPIWIDFQTPIINALVFWAIVNQLYALLVDMASGDRDSMQTEVNTRAALDIDPHTRESN